MRRSSSRRWARFLRAILLCGTAIALSGCLKSAPPARTAAAKAPANFPSDFPVYPRTKVVASEWTMNSQGKTMVRVKWEGPGRVGEALDFYRRELPSKGWEYKLDRDLQVKAISFWRQNQSASGLNRLIIAPVDETEDSEGVFIAAEIAP